MSNELSARTLADVREWFLRHWNGLTWGFTTVVAVYAAVLATYREVMSRREKRPNIRVRLFTNMLMIHGPGQTEPHIQVRVENHGYTELTFHSNTASLQVNGVDPWLLLWDNKVTDVTQWPHRLVPGASFYVMSKTQELRRALEEYHLTQIELRAVVNDAVGRQFFSDWATLKPG